MRYNKKMTEVEKKAEFERKMAVARLEVSRKYENKNRGMICGTKVADYR